MQRILVLVQIAYVLLQAAFIVEDFLLLAAFALVGNGDLQSFVQEGHLSQAVLEDVVIKDHFLEDVRIRPEGRL